jgi:ribosome-binding factor A
MERLLLKELNIIIVKEMEIPGALVTLTDVALTSDLDQARIRISVLPKNKEREVLESLGKNRKSFRHLLVKKLSWRLIPELIFEIDEGVENAATVEKILLGEKDIAN